MEASSPAIHHRQFNSADEFVSCVNSPPQATQQQHEQTGSELSKKEERMENVVAINVIRPERGTPNLHKSIVGILHNHISSPAGDRAGSISRKPPE